jgi:hypothetical protein
MLVSCCSNIKDKNKTSSCWNKSLWKCLNMKKRLWIKVMSGKSLLSETMKYLIYYVEASSGELELEQMLYTVIIHR